MCIYISPLLYKKYFLIYLYNVYIMLLLAQNDRHNTLDNLAISHGGYAIRRKCYPIFSILVILNLLLVFALLSGFFYRAYKFHTFQPYPRYRVRRRRSAISFPITWSIDRAEMKTRIAKTLVCSRLGLLHSLYAKYLDL